MARNRRRTQGGVQWRRSLRNLPVRQAAAAAAAAAGKQPAPTVVPLPPPPPPPPIRAPAVPVVINRRGRARGRARGQARGRARGAAAVPVGRWPIVAPGGGDGEKNIDKAFIRNRGRYKIKRFLPIPKNVQVKRRGVVVRQMVPRRHAIYPARRQQREY